MAKRQKAGFQREGLLRRYWLQRETRVDVVCWARLPADPVSGEAWGLRSYESSYSDPRPGKDVFDVRSLSDRKGLNGIAYSEW